MAPIKPKIRCLLCRGVLTHVQRQNKNEIDRKLNDNTLIQRELVNSNVRFPKNQVASFVWFLQLVEMYMPANPKNHTFLTLDHQIIQNTPRDINISQIQEIRRPLLARGTKAACFGIVRFSTISGHAFQLSGYAFVPLAVSNQDQIPSPVQLLRIRLHSSKVHLFSSLFQRLENYNAVFNSSNIHENRFRNPLKTISMKRWSTQYLPCQNLDLEVPNPAISIQKSIRRWFGNEPENKMKFQDSWSPKANE